MNPLIRLYGWILCRVFHRHAFWGFGRDEFICTRGWHREPGWDFEPIVAWTKGEGS